MPRGKAPLPSSGVLPSRQSMVYRTILSHLLRRCTRLLMVLPSRQRSAMCSLVSYEEGAHRSKVIVSSLRWRLILYCLRQLFCFVAFLSACGQTRRMWRVRQGSSLSWLSIHIRLQGRKPGESNKLFDLIVLPQDTIRPIRKIRGKNKNHKHSCAWRALP